MIRPVAPADAAAVLALLHEAHTWNLANGFNFSASTMTMEELAERLQPARFFVAELDGRLVGTVEVKPQQTPPAWSLHLLAVAPDAASRGIGRALVAFAEAAARQAGAPTLRLNTPADHPWLPAFYQRLGYTPYATEQFEGKQYRSVWLEKAL